jgi:hypothetical protein
MNLDGFTKEVVEHWTTARSAQSTAHQFNICGLQEEAHFYFGNSGLGFLSIIASLEKCSYGSSFRAMCGTPFSVLAARHFDQWLHLALIHVHTAFLRGLPVQPGLGDLNEMRRFAALTYSHARSSKDLFPIRGSACYALSPDYKPVVLSLGYVLVQLSFDNKTRVIRGFLLDYLYGVGHPDTALGTIEHFYDDIAAG